MASSSEFKNKNDLNNNKKKKKKKKEKKKEKKSIRKTYNYVHRE